jgi:hypothetical protein
MKPTRILASATLIVSSLALITAAGISVGDEPGVLRMESHPPMAESAVPPVPDPMSSGVATLDSGPPEPYMGIYPQPAPYAPYFERSYGATQQLPPSAYQGAQPFGPIMMFETNIGDGLGYQDSYQRLNARVPYHIIPNTNVLIGDVSASVTNNGDPLANVGAIYRNYDASTNRILGWNAYGDYDQGYGNGDWYQIGAGFESLGKYLDFRANGYYVTGTDSRVLSSELVGGLFLAGNNVFRTRNQVRDNAYSGFDAEVGGPLPILGQYGINMYLGGYYLTNDQGNDAPGFQARWQALITESLRLNTYLTSDDTFGTNSWVSLQYDIPNYKNRRVLRDSPVRDRLQDPVIRNNRIHTNIDRTSVAEACINSATGLAYNLMYVDPNSTGSATGSGTFENPYTSMQLGAAANSPAFDVIRVTPRDDASGTNLTINGGLTLFDDQALISSNSDYELFRVDTTPFFIPGTGSTGPGPLLTRPDMVAGGSVVRLANNNTIVGMQFDSANAGGTIFGNGVANPLPITNVNLTGNTFSNYVVGASLQDISGRVIIQGNTFTGRPVTESIRSIYGLDMTVAAGSTADLLLTGNTATNNQTAGLSVIANAGSTLNADKPNGITPALPVPAGKYVYDSGATGITNNTTTNNTTPNTTNIGNGIVVRGLTGSTINAVVENNTSTGNGANGFFGETDGGLFNLASMRNNTFSNNGENGAFLHYHNGGIFRAVTEDRTEDLNLNGILDPGEDTNGNDQLDAANGMLDVGEDLNGNGLLDQGIVSNTMSNNTIAGLCIFGENASTGVFDIGGPTTELGNSFLGNLNAGVAVDLRNTATAQMDTLNNVMSSAAVLNSAPTLTYVLDFVDAGQTITDPFGGGVFTPFDVTTFGFATTDYDTVTNAVLDSVRQHYYNIPTVGTDSRSPMPDGQQLDLNFVIGDLGSAPSIGATEYYTAVIGSAPTAPALGVAFLSAVRDASGNGPNFGFTNGAHVASVYSNQIATLGGLTPADVFIPVEPPGVHYDIAGGDGTPILSDALTSGNLTFTRNALAGTLSHEIGHTLSLTHMNLAGSVTPSGVAPIMGTGAIDLPNQARITPREFGYSGFDGENGNAPIAHVQQLIGAVGTRSASSAGLSGDGIRVVATDSAHLKPSTFINNTVTNNSGTGIGITMNDSAVAEGVTIQGNTISGNTGRGIDLQANGAAASIIADGTIGGTGINVLSGSSFSQGNTINNNQSDGLRAFASNGGTIVGNAIKNRIEQNSGNGIALAIDNGGTVDFGTLPNRRIEGNNITGNGGSGISLLSNVSATSEADMLATIRGSTINNNVSGGIVSTQTGPNNSPPALPAVVDNNRLTLNVGGTGTANANVLNANGAVGIGVEVAGNAKAVVAIENTSVTGTVAGSDPRWNGDGLGLKRSGSSLLLATVNNSTFTGNAGDGMDVDAQGADRFDLNQPMSGTANNVTVTKSAFNNNGQNGASYRVRGNATLIGDVTNSSFNNNGQNGTIVQTSQFSSFGDPTDGLPPGRRSKFDGNTYNDNGVDGVQLVATDDSRVLVEITSTTVPGSTTAHAGANTNGNTSISRNGRDGVRIDTTGGRSDILITSGTGQTTIDGNGTTAGGNGVRWNSSGDSDGTVRVTRTIIRNSIAGITESTAGNGNGVLDPGEDLNGNGVLDPGEDTNSNQDVDVADGDGIQANFHDNATATLVVGGDDPGDGNTIQSNADDGIAITATGQEGSILGPAARIPRPIITITGNKIGGESNGIAAGNGGDGISVNLLGGADVGIAPEDVDFETSVPPDFSDTTVSFSGGENEDGAIPVITIKNNTISQNSRKGANVLLTGAAGERDRFNALSPVFDPVRITFANNTIISNGEEGIFYRADSDMNQSRFVYLPNFPEPPVTGLDNQNFLPGRTEFFNLNLGSINGNTEYMDPYLNLRTVQNSLLTVTGNTIQQNGTGGVTGEGLFIKVGTGAYVAADIQDNVFGGNLEEDFRTASFLSAGQTFDSVDNTGDGTRDFVYLDDTAQLDVRFQNNSGNQIDANARGDIEIPTDNQGLGATYTNGDPLKTQFFGNINVLRRRADLFQVDNGPSLNDPNNIFQNFGITQDINDDFSRGGTNYNVRLAADPLFPNIGFAPPLP